jgi:putative SOS response-associated peptidase YedK
MRLNASGDILLPFLDRTVELKPNGWELAVERLLADDRVDGGLLLLAGLYEYWQPTPGQWERTFTIVTTDANNLMEPIHDRMPVILVDGAVDAWLLPRQKVDELRDLLSPAAEDLLIATPVSTLANSVKNDDPGVLEEVGAPGI